MAGQTMEMRDASEVREEVEIMIPTPSSEEEYPTGLRFILITIALILSIFLSALDSTIISTAIPKITDQFGAVQDVGWYGSAYAITNAAFQSSWGKGYKHFQMKRVFLSAITVFELGNIISATANSSTMLIIGRIVAGAGGGGVMTGSFIIIALTAKPQYRAAYMGVLGVTFGCASVVGPLLGGVLTDSYLTWRWCFWVNLPIGACAAILMTLSLKVPTAAQPNPNSLKEKVVSLDLPGASLVAAAMSCFVLALQRGGVSTSWRDWRVITCLVGAALLTILFVANEWRLGDKAMIQAHLLRKRAIVLNLVYIFFLAGLFFPLSFALPIQFQSVGNTTASESGIRLIPLILGVSVATMVANGILTFWRHYTPFLVVGAISATVGLAMVHSLDADAGIPRWIGYEIIVATGVGLSLQVPMIANQTQVGAEDIAAVTSLTLFIETVGQALFIASTEAAFTNSLISSLSRLLPALNPRIVLETGVTGIRTTFNHQQTNDILESYLQGCKTSHFVPLAAGGAAILAALVVAVPSGFKEYQARARKTS
ncbi:hypothetical protein LTR84_007666 [Exophiala bonariae]|uniref:Major facilitator superfamily (MFS) profile domain-containing protein n=1 Tax=Exophiala bonariae TaxID=1690606 RepID=A0AAV9NND0_9EURO|nr:hypothetical protein LTR84_007666 [Exophiala bonariae]